MPHPSTLTQAYLAKVREERLAAGTAALGEASLDAYAPHVVALAWAPMSGRQHVLRDDYHRDKPVRSLERARVKAAGFIHPQVDPTVHTLRHESGRLVFGTRTTLMAALGLTAWGLTDMRKGKIRSHKGWCLVKA